MCVSAPYVSKPCRIVIFKSQRDGQTEEEVSYSLQPLAATLNVWLACMCQETYHRAWARVTTDKWLQGFFCGLLKEEEKKKNRGF